MCVLHAHAQKTIFNIPSCLLFHHQPLHLSTCCPAIGFIEMPQHHPLTLHCLDTYQLLATRTRIAASVHRYYWTVYRTPYHMYDNVEF